MCSLALALRRFKTKLSTAKLCRRVAECGGRIWGFLPFIRLVPLGPDYLIPRLEKRSRVSTVLVYGVTGVQS
jgi:hypothetical protein